MSCSNCGTGNTPRGCKNNGVCGSGGCNKLSTFGWLSNMENDWNYDKVEVRFKNNRKGFFKNKHKIPLSVGDFVITQADREGWYDLGIVTLTGKLVDLQMKKKNFSDVDSLFLIHKKANEEEIEGLKYFRAKEENMKKKVRELSVLLNLEMKINDVEFQGDGNKAYFYYTAETKVDFRELIRNIAKIFSIRVEMCQIGLRQEASKLGGIGSCGRELCCATWYTDLKSISINAARYQQLSLVPNKLLGQCGKLKCCLNFELEAYKDAVKDFPDPKVEIVTEKGVAVCQKIDIFKNYLWFSYKNKEFSNWHCLSLKKVQQIIKSNKKIHSLENHSVDSALLSKNKKEEFLELSY